MSLFTIQTVRDLRWTDAEHTFFECIVKYAEFEEEHPTGVNSNDKYEHIQELWNNALNNLYGPIAEYVPPPPEPETSQIEEIPITIIENE